MGWDQRRTGWQDDRVAEAYDARRFQTPMQRRKHANDASIVLRLLSNAGTNLRVLDAPAGTGRMVPNLVAAGHHVSGVDLSEAMLQRAATPQEAGSGFNGYLAGEIERLPFVDDAFDAAISLRFLFHVRDPKVRAALFAEFRRVAPWLVGHVRSRSNVKHTGRWLRSRVGLSRRYRPAPSVSKLRAELEASGWTLVAAPPVSRLFSDKRIFLAKRST